MDTLRPTYRFKTNIPTAVFFSSNEPKTGTGKFGPWYRYEVTIDSQDQIIFASKGLQDRLARLGNLYGRVLEITKKEGENNRIFWEIKEQGQLITPHLSEELANASTDNSSADNSLEERLIAIERRLNTASLVVKELIDRLQKMEEDMAQIKQHAGIRSETEQ